MFLMVRAGKSFERFCEGLPAVAPVELFYPIPIMAGPRIRLKFFDENFVFNSLRA
jgi:hypothetical protein